VPGEGPVDLPPRRPLAQGVERGAERRVGEHRSVDQHRLVRRIGRRLTRQHAIEEGVAGRPVHLAILQHLVKLGDGEGRKGAGEAGGGARREGKFGRRRQRVALLAVIAEREDQPVLGLHHLRRRVEPQPFGVAGEVGDGDEQVQRLARRKQTRAARGGCHRVERIEQHSGEARAAERRLEPARAHEVGELAAHLLARVLVQRLQLVRAASGRHPRQRQRPCLREARGGRSGGVDQRLHVAALQPHVGQRIERLARRDRLRQEDAVDAPGARPGKNIGQDPHAQRAFPRHLVEQFGIDAGGAARPLAVMTRTAGAGEVPHLLGDAVHIDREADPAVTDQRQPQFLLARVGMRGRAHAAAISAQIGRWSLALRAA